MIGDFNVMSMIMCPECGNEISARAMLCPKCGCINTKFNHNAENVVEDVVANKKPANKDALVERFELLIENQINVKDDMINKLHSELQNYKNDQAENFITQVMKSVIRLRQSLRKKQVDGTWEKLEADELIWELGYIIEDMEELLRQHDIDVFVSEPGTQFDASKHRIVSVEETHNSEIDKTVKVSLSDGYIKNDKVIIPERIIVWQYKESEE